MDIVILVNCFFGTLFDADIETSALEEKNRRDHYTQLVGACLVRIACFLLNYNYYAVQTEPFVFSFQL